MAPVVHGLEAKYNSQMNFVYLDIDDPNTNQFKDALLYKYQPHIFLLDGDGVVLRQWVGIVAGEELELAVLEALK